MKHLNDIIETSDNLYHVIHVKILQIIKWMNYRILKYQNFSIVDLNTVSRNQSKINST